MADLSHQISDLRERVTELEMLLTHQQRAISDLDDVVQDQSGRLAKLELRFGQVVEKLAQVAAAISGGPDSS